MNKAHDPAIGRSKAQRAFGESQDKRGVRPTESRVRSFLDYGLRDADVGMFSGPRPKYVAYNASPAAASVIKRKGA